jgi:hypothetical protein
MMIPDEVIEGFRALHRARFRGTPEERRRRRRRDEILTGLMLIGFAIATPFLYMVSGVVMMMSGTSPVGWTITTACAAFFLWAGISLLARKG